MGGTCTSFGFGTTVVHVWAVSRHFGPFPYHFGPFPYHRDTLGRFSCATPCAVSPSFRRTLGRFTIHIYIHECFGFPYHHCVRHLGPTCDTLNNVVNLGNLGMHLFLPTYVYIIIIVIWGKVGDFRQLSLSLRSAPWAVFCNIMVICAIWRLLCLGIFAYLIHICICRSCIYLSEEGKRKNNNTTAVSSSNLGNFATLGNFPYLLLVCAVWRLRMMIWFLPFPSGHSATLGRFAKQSGNLSLRGESLASMVSHVMCTDRAMYVCVCVCVCCCIPPTYNERRPQKNLVLTTTTSPSP